MNANGQVILVNPNGVVFTEGSQVNVGGIVATTKNITDQDFQNGNYKFEGNSNASILNKGTIKTKNGGYVALVADQVVNEGRIEATLGRVELASGNKFTINLNNDSLVKLTIDEGTLNSLVENKGIIKADGGKIYLTTQAVDSILDGVVNNTGIIEAQSLSSNENGEVVLFAHGGTAEIGGEIKAEGGFVETSGKEFKIQQGATVKAKNWLIDPVNITIDSTLAGTISTALAGGDVTITTAGSNTPSTTSGESGTAGDITVNSAISWTSNSDLTLHADRNININADITATNATAKLILEYGQGAVAASNTADYNIKRGATVNLHAGQNFSTKLGNDGVVVDYIVIDQMGTQNAGTLGGNFAIGVNGDLAGVAFTSTDNFTGRLTGLGHTISNITSTTNGLFSNLNGATIRDLTLDNITINSTRDYVGAITGSTTYSSGVLIKNVTVRNSTITNTKNGWNIVGGIVGSLSDGTIESSSVNANITGTGVVGGIVGFMGGGSSTVNPNPTVYYVSKVLNSYSNGSITTTGTTGRAGGIVGLFGGIKASLDNTYSVASVAGTSASSSIGGLVGGAEDNVQMSILNSYASGAITAPSSTANIGGTIGRIYSSESTTELTLSNVYWDSTTTGQLSGVGSTTTSDTTVTGSTTAIANSNVYTQSNYSGFDFTNTWFMVDGYTRPFLRMEASNVITNAHELQLMSMDLGNSYKLANDINLAPSLTNKSEMWKDNSSSVNFSDYKGSFSPIGLLSNSNSNVVLSGTAFTGKFDGLGHNIDSLFIDKTADVRVSTGLLGQLKEQNFVI